MKLGIDFGTCFSFMSTMIGTDVRTTLVDDADKYSGIPTLFMHTKDPSVDYFGRSAFDRRMTFPNDYKKEIKKDIRMHPERISLDATYTYPIGGKYYKAESIVEKFITYLVDTAKKNAKAQGIPDSSVIDEITITAPVGLNSDSNAMEATALYNEMLIRVAKKVSGIKDDSRVHVLGEPVAAAMYNIHKNNSEGKQTILVYDLGGGTFDAAIVEYNPKGGTKGKFEAIATGGYTDVGGGDWDNCLKEIIKKKTNFSGIKIEGSGYVPENSKERERFEQSIVEAKILLSKKTKALVDFNIGRTEYAETVSREEFEQASRPFLEKTIKIVNDVLRTYEEQKDLATGSGIKNIDRIVLVGGASQMPQVRNRLMEVFPQFPATSIYLDEPQLAIAAGASINNNMPVRPRVLHTYGIGSNYTVDEAEYKAHKNDKYIDPDDGEEMTKYWIQEEDGVKEYKRRGVSNIIMKGATIDNGYAEASSTYSPLSDRQTKVGFNVYVSESSEDWSDYEKPSLFGYTVEIPSEFHGKATQYSIIAEFRITDDGVVILKTYEEKDGKRGKEIGHGRFPK